MLIKKHLIPALIALPALVLAGCATSTPEPSATASASSTATTEEAPKDPVAVAVITSQTGFLASYGNSYLEGFEAGLDYATGGTLEVNGHKIEVSILDDGGDADTAVSHAKDAIGNGTKILLGTVSSGIALTLAEQAAQNQVLYISGPAAADAITGVNGYTFRSGRQTYQDVATAGTFIGNPSGKKVAVFAQDTAFGQGNLAGVDIVLGGKGANVEGVLVPEDATEFTPFARQLVAAEPDLIFVAWAGATSGAMWQALTQQGVFDIAPVVTGLGDVATYGAYSDAGTNISFLNHYFAGAAGTAVETEMLTRVEAAGGVGDLFTPDGFLAAQMLVRAIEASADDVDAMVAALEGAEFDGPKGTTIIRAEDHAVIQPMFQARLVKSGDNFVPELISVVDSADVAPPVAQ